MCPLRLTWVGTLSGKTEKSWLLRRITLAGRRNGPLKTMACTGPGAIVVSPLLDEAVIRDPTVLWAGPSTNTPRGVETESPLASSSCCKKECEKRRGRPPMPNLCIDTCRPIGDDDVSSGLSRFALGQYQCATCSGAARMEKQ
jgi:hypothetical protein